MLGLDNCDLGRTLFGSQLETAIRRVYDELDGKLSRD